MQNGIPIKINWSIIGNFPRPNLINPAQNRFQEHLLIRIENPKPQTLRSNHCFHIGTRMVRPFHPKILTETKREINT